MEGPLLRLCGKTWAWGVGLALCLLPYFLINIYNEPSSDDFKYAANYRELGAWEAGKKIYFGTCGRYATNVFLHWSPLSLGWMEGYRWTGFALLAGLSASFYYLLWPLLPKLRGPVRHLGVWTVVALFLYKIPSLNQGLYWFTGAYTYTFAIVCLNFFIGLLIRARGWSPNDPKWEFQNKNKEIELIAGGTLCLGLAFGSTELAVIYGAIGLGLLNIWLVFIRRKWDPTILGLTMLGAVFGLLCLMAPGNFLRSDSYELAHDFGRLIKLVPLYQVWFLGSFCSLPLVLMAIVAGGRWASFGLPAAGSFIRNASRWIPVLLFLFFMILTFSFGIWATGNRPARRALNVLYYIQFLLVLVMLLQSLWADRGFWAFLRGKIPLSDRGILAVAFLALLLTGNSGKVWGDLVVRGPEYRRQVESRYQAIRESGGGEVVVEPIRNKPKCLFFEDITHQPTDWQNLEMARYFKVSSIRLSRPDTDHPARE